MQPKNTRQWEDYVDEHGPSALLDLPNETMYEWGGVLYIRAKPAEELNQE